MVHIIYSPLHRISEVYVKLDSNVCVRAFVRGRVYVCACLRVCVCVCAYTGYVRTYRVVVAHVSVTECIIIVSIVTVVVVVIVVGVMDFF